MDADARAGAIPSTLTRSVLAMTLNAMPSAPSTNCATKPTNKKGMIALIWSGVSAGSKNMGA